MAYRNHFTEMGPGDPAVLRDTATVVGTFEACTVCGRDYPRPLEAVVFPGYRAEDVVDAVHIAELCDACWAWALGFDR